MDTSFTLGVISSLVSSFRCSTVPMTLLRTISLRMDLFELADFYDLESCSFLIPLDLALISECLSGTFVSYSSSWGN